MLTFKKWSPQEVKEVKRAIRSVLNENKKAKGKVIAERLNAMQIKHPNKEQWSNQEVFSFLKKYPTRVRQAKANGLERVTEGKEKTEHSTERLAVAEIIFASLLGPKDKEKILASLFSGAL